MAKKELKNKKDKTSFAKNFKAEIKKVIWPTPKQLFNNTAAVLGIVLITTLIVFALDFTFESINKYGVNKIKQVVSNSSTENTTSENTTTEEQENNNLNTENTNTENTSVAE